MQFLLYCPSCIDKLKAPQWAQSLPQSYATLLIPCGLLYNINLLMTSLIIFFISVRIINAEL